MSKPACRMSSTSALTVAWHPSRRAWTWAADRNRCCGAAASERRHRAGGRGRESRSRGPGYEGCRSQDRVHASGHRSGKPTAIQLCLKIHGSESASFGIGLTAIRQCLLSCLQSLLSAPLKPPCSRYPFSPPQSVGEVGTHSLHCRLSLSDNCPCRNALDASWYVNTWPA